MTVSIIDHVKIVQNCTIISAELKNGVIQISGSIAANTASGTYIFYLDDDRYVPNNFVQAMVSRNELSGKVTLLGLSSSERRRCYYYDDDPAYALESFFTLVYIVN